MAGLLRTFLDQPTRHPRPPVARRRCAQGDTQTEKRRRPMNAPTNPDAYGTLIEPTTLKIQRMLPGPIERVWAYLTDGDLRRKWLAAGSMEMQVGAPFEFVWRNNELSNPPGKR